jgi:hypothetical protein
MQHNRAAGAISETDMFKRNRTLDGKARASGREGRFRDCIQIPRGEGDRMFLHRRYA